MQDLTVTLIQTYQYWQDKEANHHHFKSLIDQITLPTDLIILPEMWSTGFSMDANRLAESMEGDTVAWMARIANERNACLIGSVIIVEHGLYYNRLIAAMPDDNIVYYDKRHCFRMAGEDKIYTPGQKLLTLEINGWKIRPFVCYDLRFPVWSRNKYDAVHGWDYDLSLYIANWPAARAYAWKSLAIARAIENQSYVITVNRIGEDTNGNQYSGDSQVINSYGQVLHHLDDQAYVKTITLEKSLLVKHRLDFPVGLDADKFEFVY